MARTFTDGGSGVLTSPNQSFASFINDFSAAFWFYRTGAPGALRGIVGQNTGASNYLWLVGLNSGIQIQAGVRYSTAHKIRTSSTTPALNTWVHVVVVHTNTGLASTDIVFYFNGVLEAGIHNTTGSGTQVTGTTPLQIGLVASTSALAPPAIIGPVALWNRAISPAEALALAGGAHPLRFREGLVEAYDMNGGDNAVEEGAFGVLPLAPTSSPVFALNPPVEPAPVWPQIAPYGHRPVNLMRARYMANPAAAGTPTYYYRRIAALG